MRLVARRQAATRPHSWGGLALDCNENANRKKATRVAVARMMPACPYRMLLTSEVFGPSYCDEPREGEPVRERLTEDSALRLLRELGYNMAALNADG